MLIFMPVYEVSSPLKMKETEKSNSKKIGFVGYSVQALLTEYLKETVTRAAIFLRKNKEKKFWGKSVNREQVSKLLLDE